MVSIRADLSCPSLPFFGYKTSTHLGMAHMCPTCLTEAGSIDFTMKLSNVVTAVLQHDAIRTDSPLISAPQKSEHLSAWTLVSLSFISFKS